jgi:ABC-2 type transport system permease protein
VRSGDVALDLARPASLQLWYLAEDLGRAAYLFIMRSVPPTLAGAALFGLVVPDALRWPAFMTSLVLAVIVSFALRYLVALSACWILDERGVQSTK